MGYTFIKCFPECFNVIFTWGGFIPSEIEPSLSEAKNAFWFLLYSWFFRNLFLLELLVLIFLQTAANFIFNCISLVSGFSLPVSFWICFFPFNFLLVYAVNLPISFRSFSTFLSKYVFLLLLCSLVSGFFCFSS